MLEICLGLLRRYLLRDFWVTRGQLETGVSK